jgi:putative aldouronate transport system permease protein
MAKKKDAFSIINYSLFFMFTVIVVYPFWDVLMGSFMEYNDYVSASVRLYPKSFTVDAYKSFFIDNDFFTPLKNTVFVTVFGTVLSMLVSVMGAYALSKKFLVGRNILMYGIVFTMYFSGGIIPLYMVMRGINLTDTLAGIIMVATVNTFFLIVMRTYFAAQPISIEESAKIDGAGYFRILFTIVLPMSMPIIATMILFYAVNKWNELFRPIILLHSEDKKLLQPFLHEFFSTVEDQSYNDYTYASKSNITPKSQKMAAIIMTTTPILCVYPFLQKYFVKGVMIGSIKG